MLKQLACLLLIPLGACAAAQSAAVPDQVRGLVGKSQEDILSCMGVPSAQEKVGQTEVWTYSTVSGASTSVLVSGNESFIAGAGTTSSHYCLVNLTFRDGEVTHANYRSQGKLLSPAAACYPMLHACVPETSNH